MEEKKQKGKKAIISLLRMIDEGTTETAELFEQWARRRKYRLDPEEQLAEDRLREQREYRNRMAYLKRKKLVTSKKMEGRLFIELSNEGRVELMKWTMRERPRLLDGYVCLVLYDVPVNARRGRDALRYFLKGAGFEQVQKSAWQSDRDVMKDVEDFVKSARIQKWVTVYIGRKQC
ncbi:hypothetical protein HY630_02230 [Candidatus Uhrbacteria bacterium]|nr:hypothetical protein [Candidatus Uhrbacteria bacterium]